MSGRPSRRHSRGYERRPRSRSRGRERAEPHSPREEGSRSHHRHSESVSIDRNYPNSIGPRGRKRERSQTPSMHTSIRSHSPRGFRGRSVAESPKEDTRSHPDKKRRKYRSRSRSRSLSPGSSASSRSRRRSGGKRLKDKKRKRGEKRSETRRESEKDVRRSILTGKKIKLKVHKDAADLERDSNREELLQFLNSSC
ncbi:hypothetical protein BJ322DRAFT_1048047 [Thelephora terrestris]|uniref:Uncharacterized protein n=1 Tax=Thelephora terrestris TaxID=56493 RepID=A0A9P6HJ84_9AGAM|nr:hypothetical protein BJ322DRAFT_1048047 [Thelephora terrestris]